MPIYSLQNNQKPRSLQPIVDVTTNTLGTFTVKEVFGTGRLIAIFGSVSGATTASIIVTVDGVTSTISKSSNIWVNPLLSDDGTITQIDVNFKRSFKIEHSISTTGGGISLRTFVSYELE